MSNYEEGSDPEEAVAVLLSKLTERGRRELNIRSELFNGGPGFSFVVNGARFTALIDYDEDE